MNYITDNDFTPNYKHAYNIARLQEAQLDEGLELLLKHIDPQEVVAREGYVGGLKAAWRLLSNVDGVATAAVAGGTVGGPWGALIAGLGKYSLNILGTGLEMDHEFRAEMANHEKAQRLSGEIGAVYDTFYKSIKSSESRFNTYKLQEQTTKKRAKNKAALAHVNLQYTAAQNKATYLNRITKLKTDEIRANAELDNAIIGLATTKQSFKLQKEILFERFQVDKQKYNAGFNAITSKYYLAGVAKDMRALRTARFQQQQRLSALTFSSKSLTRAQQISQGSLRSIKQIGDSLALANDIEQSNLAVLLNYRNTIADLKEMSSRLKTNRATAEKQLQLDLAKLTHTAATTLNKLDASKRSLNATLEGLALQRQSLGNAYSSFNRFFDAKRRLIDEELELDIATQSQRFSLLRNREYENYMSLINQRNKFDRDTTGLIQDFQHAFDLGNVEQAQQLLSDFSASASNTLDSVARLKQAQYQVDNPDLSLTSSRPTSSSSFTLSPPTTEDYFRRHGFTLQGDYY